MRRRRLGASPAVEGGARLLESELTSRFGVNIHLPREISLDELGRMIGFAIPHDLRSAINAAVAAGSAAVSSTITGLLTGAGIGSIIPGLGTVVGIVTALVMGELAGLLIGLFAEEPRLTQKRCTRTTWCPPPSQQESGSGFALIAYAANQFRRASLVHAEELRDGWCGVPGPGSAYECMQRMGTLIEAGIAATRGTARSMTAPEVELALQLEYVDDTYWMYNRTTDWGDDWAVRKVTRRSSQESWQPILVELQARKVELAALGDKVLRLQSLAPGEVSTLRDLLALEVPKTAYAVFASQGGAAFEPNLFQLALVTQAYAAVAAKLQQAQVDLAAQIARMGPHVTTPAAPPAAVLAVPTCDQMLYQWASGSDNAVAAMLGPESLTEVVRLCEEVRAGKLSAEAYANKVTALVRTKTRTHERRNSVLRAFVGSFLDTGTLGRG
jgi:hypothetical protein